MGLAIPAMAPILIELSSVIVIILIYLNTFKIIGNSTNGIHMIPRSFSNPTKSFT